MQRNDNARRGGLVVTLIFVLVGPLAVFLLHVIPFHVIDRIVAAGHFDGSAPSVLLRAVNPLGAIALIYYYVIGLVPALGAAELAKWRLRRLGVLAWWHAAWAGGVVSLLATAFCQFVEFPQLVFIDPRYKDASPVDYPIMFASGFIATGLAWLAARKRLAVYGARIAAVA